MNRNYFYGVLAFTALCAIIVIVLMTRDATETTPPEQTIEHPVTPYKTSIFAVGVVESGSDNIAIGSPLNRIVEEIPVTVGMKVKKGDILIRLDDRDLQNDLKSAEINAATAVAKLNRLEAYPRQEDLDSAKSAMAAAQEDLERAQSEFDMVQGLPEKAISLDMKNLRKTKLADAKSRYSEAKANFDKVQAGAWKPDLEIAKLEALQAQASVEKAKIDIDRTIIKSPIDGTVLQIRIHAGEMVSYESGPLMIVGNIEKMRLRVSVNQFDAHSFNPDCPATAFLQSDSRVKFPLQFDQVEPYLINKNAATFDISEKIDTRVLQVLYNFNKGNQQIYVGQQMDVFIDLSCSNLETTHE